MKQPRQANQQDSGEVEDCQKLEGFDVDVCQVGVDLHRAPLRTVADQPSGKGQIFTHKNLDDIFINIDLLIQVNESFLGTLESELEMHRGGKSNGNGARGGGGAQGEGHLSDRAFLNGGTGAEGLLLSPSGRKVSA